MTMEPRAAHVSGDTPRLPAQGIPSVPDLVNDFSKENGKRTLPSAFDINVLPKEGNRSAIPQALQLQPTFNLQQTKLPKPATTVAEELKKKIKNERELEKDDPAMEIDESSESYEDDSESGGEQILSSIKTEKDKIKEEPKGEVKQKPKDPGSDHSKSIPEKSDSKEPEVKNPSNSQGLPKETKPQSSDDNTSKAPEGEEKDRTADETKIIEPSTTSTTTTTIQSKEESTPKNKEEGNHVENIVETNHSENGERDNHHNLKQKK